MLITTITSITASQRTALSDNHTSFKSWLKSWSDHTWSFLYFPTQHSKDHVQAKVMDQLDRPLYSSCQITSRKRGKEEDLQQSFLLL